MTGSIGAHGLYTAIDLAGLPPPQIIAQPDFEAIFAARKARLIEIAEALGRPDYLDELTAALELESEPLVQLLQEDSYRELLLRAAVQDAGKGNLLAFAQGAVLDHLGAFYGVARQVIQEADNSVSPPIEQVLENDIQFRLRIQLAPEGFSTAGPAGAYIFWGRTASPLVKDVAVSKTAVPGQVAMTILSTEGDGTPSDDLLQQVIDTVTPRKPLCSELFVHAPQIVPYSIEASLILYEGPGADQVLQEALKSVEDFVAARHRLGHDITIAALHAALVRPGVQNVTMANPTTDLVIAGNQVAWCADINVTIGGRDV